MDMTKSTGVVGDSTVIFSARRKTDSTTKFVGDASCVPLDCLRLMNALLGPCPGAEACDVRFEVSILGEVRRQHGFLDEVPMVPALGLIIIVVVTTCTRIA